MAAIYRYCVDVNTEHETGTFNTECAISIFDINIQFIRVIIFA